jgi:energy-coupling factor transport system permease protein
MYVARASGLHRLNPLTKAMLAVFILAAGLAFPGDWTGYFLVVFIILPLAVWGKIYRDLTRTVWNISWPFALSVLLIQTFFWGAGTPFFEIWVLAPKREGALFALMSIGRILLTMATIILFGMTTRPDMLMISLKQAGMPSSLAYIVVTTLQIIPSFQRKALTILDAQRSRGLETGGNMIMRGRAVVPIILPLVIGSLMDVEERAIAIQARAFNSKREETSLIEIEDTAGQAVIRKLLILFTILSVAARVAWELSS